MDLNDYWQENKRFVTTVLAGLVVFLIAYFWIDSRQRSGTFSRGPWHFFAVRRHS